MKKYLLLLLLCPLPLVTCVNSKDTVRTLNLAEELMSSRPDSSLALLITIHPGRQDSRQAHARYALLRTMALDKNYIDVADDSLARVAYDYFQRHGSKDYRMKSSYYLGVVKENAEELIDAAILFKEAEGLAEELKDYHFLGLSRQHLSGIFAKNYDHNEALEYALKAEKAFSEAHETLSESYSWVDAANQYRALGKIEQAEAIIDSLLSRPDLQTKGLSNYLYAQKGFVFAEKKDYKHANESFKKAQITGYPLSIGGLGLLATTEEWLGHSYTADSLISEIQKHTPSQIDSIILYNAIHNVLILRKDYKNAYSAMITATELQDKTIVTLLNRSLTHSFKSYYESKYLLEKERSISRLYIIIFIVIILLFTSALFISGIRERNQKILKEMSIIKDINVDLSSLRDRNKDLSTIINALLQDKITVMSHISDTYFGWTDEMVSKKERKEGTIMKEEAISQFRHQIQQLRDDKKFIRDIECSLDHAHNGIMSKLRINNGGNFDHSFKEIDYNILTLLFAGFSIKSISFLMNMTEPSIRTRKTRYKQMFEKLDDEDSRFFVKLLS